MKINGTEIAKSVTDELKQRIANGKRPPTLAIILVGKRKDSELYVKMKLNTAESIGIKCELIQLDETVSEIDLLKQVQTLNKMSVINGIIVQLPLPIHISSSNIISSVLPSKDVDGYHPQNLGQLLLNEAPLFTSCTARGVMMLLDKTIGNDEIAGKKVCLIGCGMVGKPLSMLLLQKNATVFACNKHTKEVGSICAGADIIVAAAGCPHLVKKDWIKPGAIVIDVGINSIKDETRKSGYRLVGDVDYDNVVAVASHITPVPGGVGPMTVAMLMLSVVESWERSSSN